MASSKTHRAMYLACGLIAALFAGVAHAADDAEPIVAPPPEFASRQLVEPRAASGEIVGLDGTNILDPAAAQFDQWDTFVDPPSAECDDPPLRPFDWMRHWGFRHSSTEGRHTERGVPLQYSSWLNRPYHIDWFAGPMLSDNHNARVLQTNEVIVGLRAGWDFDYYWGVEWRFGWSDPDVLSDTQPGINEGRLFISDVDLLYYPWGDTKVRPYFQWGLGMMELDTLRDDGTPQQVTLLTMPFGVGVQFPLTRWLTGRLEVLDNVAFGNDGVDTMNNISFTAGMEMRLGAKPNSYWPWRTSRTVW